MQGEATRIREAERPICDSGGVAALLTAEALVKTFGRVRVVDRVSFEVSDGQAFALLGPSGCGKTTTLRMIAGLEEPDEGRIRLDGRDITPAMPHKRSIGFVFQDFALFPHLSVFENVAFGLRVKRLRKEEIARRVAAAMESVRLPISQFGERLPDQLSGGQRQRVAIARTLVIEPDIILFDEPLAALDRHLRDHMLIELKELQRRNGLSAIYVTHDQDAAMILADRLAVMNAGRIEQIGPPLEVYRRPASRFVAEFLGEINLIPMEVVGNSASETRLRADGLELTAGASKFLRGHQVTAGIRPADLRVGGEPARHNAFRAKLLANYTASTAMICQLQLQDGTEFRARLVEASAPPQVGLDLWLSVDPLHIALLPASSPLPA